MCPCVQGYFPQAERRRIVPFVRLPPCPLTPEINNCNSKSDIVEMKNVQLGNGKDRKTAMDDVSGPATNGVDDPCCTPQMTKDRFHKWDVVERCDYIWALV